MPQPQIEIIPLAALTPYARNARTHSAEQLAQLVASLREFGFTNPVLIDGDGGIIAGHGRVLAAQQVGLTEVPCLRLGHLTETQKRAYILADNRLALNAGWDMDLLAQELAALTADSYDTGLTGFEDQEIADLLALAERIGQPEGEQDPDAVPEAPAVPHSQTGDLWLLGRHRLRCGDSTQAEEVARLMGGEIAALLHADPPYGMGKEKDGVVNDNLYGPDLDAFQMRWWSACRPHLADNASAYVWGNAPDLWRLWYRGGLADAERLTFRNEIVWDKGSAGAGGISHMGAEGLRQYPNGSERCLFFMLGEQGFNTNADNYWDGWEGIRSSLAADCAKMGWGAKDIERICGVGMHSHWFTKSQWTFIPADHYQKLQQAARDHDAFKRDHDDLKRDHDDLKRDHDDLKRDFYATRAYFNNSHDNMTDAWAFNRVTGEDRHGHATPKPVAMLARVMLSSLPAGGLAYEPFSGSGSTIIAAEQTGRRCYAMEISPLYVDVAVRRWQSFTGQRATHAVTGKPFPG